MQNIRVELECEMGDSFRCQKAADSVSLDPKTKSKHILEIEKIDIGRFSVGLIVGASGSGKTTLARKLFGEHCFKEYLNNETPIIDQFPKEWSYDQCAQALSGMGLTSVPCWIRPAYTLSNGQKARAEAALGLAHASSVHVIDEWTSVVDRTVAKVMSHSIQKHARSEKAKVGEQKRIVLLSCHYDVVGWLDPDWIIDCNKQIFIDRRSLPAGERRRREELRFEVRRCDKRTWRYFSKYHYLSENLAPDTKFTFGIFEGDEQVGFVAFTRYAFKNPKMLHSNRVVIHPDYVGLGLGIKMVDVAAKHLSSLGFEIRAKFTSLAMLRARIRNPAWALIKKERVTSRSQGAVLPVKTKGKPISARQISGRNQAKSFYVTYYTFRFVGEKRSPQDAGS